MSEIQAFYDSHEVYEWDRLKRHPLEFALNMRMLAAHLPEPPCTVLDVGGGPGRYAISLAERGYRVTLFDLSANLLAFARARAAEAGVTLADTVHGNALDLGRFADAAFDAVLLMGPMYHLLSPADRDRALGEAHRVLKPGGILVTSFINRYATLRTHSPQWTLQNLARVQAELETGLRYADGHFTDSYSAHPSEVPPLLEKNGFRFLEMIGSEGLQSDKDEAMVQLTVEQQATWADLNYPIAKDPMVLGAAVHLLAAARRDSAS